MLQRFTWNYSKRFQFTNDSKFDENNLYEYEGYNLFWSGEIERDVMIELAALELESIDSTKLRDSIGMAMTDKSYDGEQYNDEGHLKYNPLPPILLNKKQFIGFAIK